MLDSGALRFARTLLVAGFSIAGVLATGAASAQVADDQSYRQTTDEAVREFDAGHWEEARALFKRAHEISPNARTLRGMGMAAFEMRMYVQAIRELDAALRDPRKPLDAELRTHVQQLLDKAHEFVGKVTLVLEPTTAKVLIDGRPPQFEPDQSVLLDVGTHVVSASADGYKPTNLRLSVEGGSDQELRVPLEPLLAGQAVVPAIDTTHPQPATPATTAPIAPAPNPQKPAARAKSHLGTFAWVALGGAAAFGATSAAFWLIGGSKYSDLQKSCTNQCSDSQIQPVKTDDTLTNVFLGLAAASGAAAIVLFAINAGQSSGSTADTAHSDRPQLMLHAGPTGASLEGQF